MFMDTGMTLWDLYVYLSFQMKTSCSRVTINDLLPQENLSPLRDILDHNLGHLLREDVLDSSLPILT